VDVIIKKSRVGQFENGVFAKRDFEKGEIVIAYTLKSLTKKDFEELPDIDKTFVHEHKGTLYLYSEPERYVNHSKDPNTIQDLKKNCDIAKRLIRKGEEITTDATKDDIF